MAEHAPASPRPRAGRTENGRRRLRNALAVAALDLFVAQGYEATTVEDIVGVVGVGRRTFFRYFRSKEDVVFPDHDDRVAEVVRELETADPSEPPLSVVSRTAEIVLEMYLAEPEVSVKRFALTRQVPSLRDKEIASIDRYQRVFGRFLRRRFLDLDRDAGRDAAGVDGELRAAVAASAVVATHNHVLRTWLRRGGDFDARARLREALRHTVGRLTAEPGATEPSPESEQVVVGVVRTTAGPEQVHEAVQQALRELRPGSLGAGAVRDAPLE